MTAPEENTPRPGLLSRLYHGETDFNIVGRWKLWFAISGSVILIGIAALAANGLNFGIDFTGGTVWEVPAGNVKVVDVTDAMADLGYEDVQVQIITQATGDGTDRFLRVEAEAVSETDARTTKAINAAVADLEDLSSSVKGQSRVRMNRVVSQLDGVEGPFEQAVPAELEDLQEQVDDFAESLDAKKTAVAKSDFVLSQSLSMLKKVDALADAEQLEREAQGRDVTDKLAELTGSKSSEVAIDTVGPSWGEQISDKARTALIVFLVVITGYITVRFEFKMAAATLAALIHDLLVVVGIYALFGFPVTPATVIALLTILGFSIYDGIVVFDRVDENTKLLGRKSKLTYSDMANLSLNQVLMRSLNTSITALLPILTVLIVGSLVLGQATLEEFGLALFLGLMSGAYSSIFVATPLLALLKEREPRYRELRERLSIRSTTGTGGDDAEGGELISQSALGVITDVAGVTPRPRKPGKPGKKR